MIAFASGHSKQDAQTEAAKQAVRIYKNKLAALEAEGKIIKI